MAKRIAVITAKEILRREIISFRFMFASKAPRELFMGLGNTYGFLDLREKEDNELDPYKFARGEPNAIGPDGTQKWEALIGSNGEQDFYESADQTPNEEGLKKILADMPDCVLLMEEKLFAPVNQACEDLGITVAASHYAGSLATS
jgi:hypothetical protein